MDLDYLLANVLRRALVFGIKLSENLGEVAPVLKQL